MKPFATVGGIESHYLKVHLVSCGLWYAKATLVDDTELPAGPTRVCLGDLDFSGTLRYQSSFGGKTTVDVIAGANGWNKRVPKKSYHSDGMVTAITVVRDLVREVKEQLGRFEPEEARLKKHFIRIDTVAARVLKHAIGDRDWWLDNNGVTHVGKIAQSKVVGDYEVLNWDGLLNIVTIATDDLQCIRLGSVIRQRVTAPFCVRAIDYVVQDSTVRLYVSGDRI